MTNEPNTPQSKLALSRQRIVAEAVAFADTEGVDALSMRKLAERLGVGAMSLYRHVSNKDEMIEAMVDEICREIEPPEVTGDWRRSIRASSASAHRVLLAHPWAAGQWTRRGPGTVRLRYMEALLAALTAAGLTPELVYKGYHAVTMHIIGFTIQELGYRTGPGQIDLDAAANEFLSGGHSEAVPHLAAHVRAHLSGEDHGDEFGFVLDLILDGLERANG